MPPSDHRLDRSVYRPAEDSELLREAATAVLEAGDLVVETGTGSGYVAEALNRDVGVTVVATDINPHACLEAADRGVAVVQGSLLSFIGDASVDVVIFNPPYLPEDDRLPDDWLTRATTGGPTGIELLLDWLEALPRVLHEDGFALCVVSTVTELDPVHQMIDEIGFGYEVVAEEAFSFERLQVLAVRPL